MQIDYILIELYGIMHTKNLSYNESRVLRLLMENSRLTISEISDKANLNRNTVSKIINYLNKEYIEKYTVETRENNDSIYFIVTVNNIDDINNENIIEYYELMNGKYMVIMNKNSLSNQIKYNKLNIAKKRFTFFNNEIIDLYCDYCNNKISGLPRTYEHNKNKYYFCCDTCKNSFIKEMPEI